MNQEEKISFLEKKIAAIEGRNKRVEADKSWETSRERKIIISLLTYFVIVSFFIVNKLPNPFINSVIPTVGFILSTLTLNIFKKWWLKKRNYNNN